MAGTGQQEARYDFLDVIIVGSIFVFFIMPLTAYGLLVFWDTLAAWSWLLVLGIIPIGLFVRSIYHTGKVTSESDAAEYRLNGAFRHKNRHIVRSGYHYEPYEKGFVREKKEPRYAKNVKRGSWLY